MAMFILYMIIIQLHFMIFFIEKEIISILVYPVIYSFYFFNQVIPYCFIFKAYFSFIWKYLALIIIIGLLYRFIHFLSYLYLFLLLIFRLFYLSRWAHILFALIFITSFKFIKIFFFLRSILCWEKYLKCQRNYSYYDFYNNRLLIFIEFWLFPFILCFKNPMYFKDFEFEN